ncbi:hypothetical protein LK996_11285 [Lysobacter sp. A6]|uniref:EF-hand domain-containing protein n=1 Tax=Noviluteimonas lactosilytica TaxID=2888523 RepID=A0ABS8JJD0_9GAMM|nr:hypothetical protein [Lysobacter lactosilyticus]MCC8363652.1 hypothetical protein [Lysobacter lactosilyticus]
MSSKMKSPLVLGAALAGGLVLTGSSFAMHPLASGYMASASAVAEGSCGAEHKDKMAAEQKTAAGDEKMKSEGKCGMDHMDADKDGKITKAEYTAAHADGGGNFDGHDANKDGVLTADELKEHMGGASET